MTIYTASNARKNFFQIIKDVCSSHKPVHISSKDKNAVVISEDDYNSMKETLYLVSIPGMRKSIMEGMKTDLKDCTDKLDWD